MMLQGTPLRRTTVRMGTSVRTGTAARPGMAATAHTGTIACTGTIARTARRGAERRRRALIAGVAAGALALAGCAAAPTESGLRSDGLRPMSEAELRAEFSRERRCRFDNWNRVTGTVSYRPDGRYDGDAGGAAFAGAWRIRDGLLCARSPQLRGGVELCLAVYATSANDRVAFGRDDDSWTRLRCTTP